MRMRHILVCQALQHFPTESHKQPDFQEDVTEYKMCFDCLYNTCLKKFLILRRNERLIMIINI